MDAEYTSFSNGWGVSKPYTVITTKIGEVTRINGRRIWDVLADYLESATEEEAIIIMTYSLPSWEESAKIIERIKYPKNLTVVCNEISAQRAEELKRKYPAITVKVTKSGHEKMLIIGTRLTAHGSANFGCSENTEHMIVETDYQAVMGNLGIYDCNYGLNGKEESRIIGSVNNHISDGEAFFQVEDYQVSHKEAYCSEYPGCSQEIEKVALDLKVWNSHGEQAKIKQYFHLTNDKVKGPVVYFFKSIGITVTDWKHAPWNRAIGARGSGIIKTNDYGYKTFSKFERIGLNL